MTTPQPRWLFPPTNGGQEYASTAAANFFTSDTLEKAIRELLQNSLDNPHGQDSPVTVTFKLLQVPSTDIGTQTLSRHLIAASQQAREDKTQNQSDRYRQMAQALQQSSLDVLAITDSNTTGLPPDKWRKLIHLEGSPTQAEDDARGGSYGLGKNAPFNLSEVNTVFYTSCLWQDDQADYQHRSIGKAQLATHKDPENQDRTLQHIGFYALHDRQPNLPLEDQGIATPFLLDEQGTAIFVIAFRKDLLTSWARRTVRATAENFFHAIHHRTLTVEVRDPYSKDVTLDHQTLPDLIHKEFPDSPVRHYLGAIAQQESQRSQAYTPDNPIKSVAYHILIGTGAPKRLAHVNSRGMLVTHERTRNPFYSRGNLDLQDWCIVAIPSANDGSDAYVRQFEPPAHDAVDLRIVEDQTEPQDQVRNNFREHQENINQALHQAAGLSTLQFNDNISELSDLLPDREPDTDPPDPEETYDVAPDEPLDTQMTSLPTTQPPQGNREYPQGQPAQPGTAFSLEGRAYLQDSDRIALVFNMPQTRFPRLAVSVYTAGEQTTRSESRIPILDIISHQGSEGPPTLTEDYRVAITAPPGRQIAITARIPPQDGLYHGYEIVAI